MRHLGLAYHPATHSRRWARSKLATRASEHPSSMHSATTCFYATYSTADAERMHWSASGPSFVRICMTNVHFGRKGEGKRGCVAIWRNPFQGSYSTLHEKKTFSLSREPLRPVFTSSVQPLDPINRMVAPNRIVIYCSHTLSIPL